MRLDELTQLLRGEIRRAGGQQAVETSIAGLRAAVIMRGGRLEIAVASTSARELDVLHDHDDEWRAPDHEIPSLSHVAAAGS